MLKKNISDSIPKTIYTFLVNMSSGICERELVTYLYKEELFEEMLQENYIITKAREENRNHLLKLR